MNSWLRNQWGGSKNKQTKNQKKKRNAIELAQLVKALATKPDHPSSYPGNHMVERQNQVL